MAALSAVPSMEDLKIKFQESSLIFPYKETPKKSIFLSNIDQILNYDIPTAHFFKVTSFKCGGFAIGMSTNHILFDGLGAKVFLLNLASQSLENKPLAIVPYNDRRILAARSPPHVSFPHPEFLKFDLPVGPGSTPPKFDCIIEEIDFKIFKLTTTHISHLKDNITKTSKIDRISTLAVVAALIWRCKAFFDDKNRVSTLLSVIDIRPRVNPPLPYSYSANAVLPLGVSETCEEIKNGPFSKLVEIITEGAKEMTHESVKSAFDWLELNRGIPHGDYMVSSWLRLGFDEVEYAWGKPMYSCPVVNHRKDICWVFRDAVDNGVCAMVALPSQEMDIFEGVFHDFFASILVH
ncbi:PREDICTED: omega-hydroxypalmitate O-feruloyl transferase-like [Erythranthe guttata]|uniref:omega-hydroxypalmitate O-feruloyl transferase-like n=1 Tax=Erythranthe guttata TaxID=4155 RepID=UPI00064DF690|nr:PREDICTED: omega-hydroxypalmitate O-feruloyl transferase-like [Erythranthe guttata]|eukprot:XP_012829363.1 PREDICTED: omega-hydroxypalmitate O-feruloyl transferase-like [Erythranthe guttata]